MSEPWLDEDVPCADPECCGMGEPEAEGDTRFYACGVCGTEFGFVRVQEDAGSCQLGVPEEVRRRMGGSPLPDGSASSNSVFIGTIGRRPE